VQRVIQTRLVRTQAHVGKELLTLLLVEGEELARFELGWRAHRSYQDLASAKVVETVEHWRARVEEFNLVAQFVMRLHLDDGLRTETVILQEDVADAGDPDARRHFAIEIV